MSWRATLASIQLSIGMRNRRQQAAPALPRLSQKSDRSAVRRKPPGPSREQSPRQTESENRQIPQSMRVSNQFHILGALDMASRFDFRCDGTRLTNLLCRAYPDTPSISEQTSETNKRRAASSAKRPLASSRNAVKLGWNSRPRPTPKNQNPRRWRGFLVFAYSAVNSGGFCPVRRGFCGSSISSTMAPSLTPTRTSPPLVSLPNSNSSAKGFLMYS